jgi:hypothetical protein
MIPGRLPYPCIESAVVMAINRSCRNKMESWSVNHLDKKAAAVGLPACHGAEQRIGV